MRKTFAFAALNVLFATMVLILAVPSAASALDDGGRCCVESTSHQKYCCANCCSQDSCSKSADCNKET